MNHGLEGKSIIVTGGASGLGAATCRTLAQAGASVVIADIHAPNAERLRSALLADGATVDTFIGDIGEPDVAQALIEHARARFGRLDVLVNNAGTDVTAPVTELSVEQWDRVNRTNLRAPFLLTRAAIPVMREQGGGDVVNVTSTAAKRGWPNASAYHATKWGLLGLSQALHAELREARIRVTAIVAGGMRTPFLLDRFPDLDPNVLQDPMAVARTIRFALELPPESVIAEVTVLPRLESSWP